MHGEHIKKQLSERCITSHSELEVCVKNLPFGKAGLHDKASEELEKLTERILCYDADSKKIKIGRHGFNSLLFGCDTYVFVTFSPEKWVYHAIYRKDKIVPYYANDLFRFNFLKAETIAKFNIRWPKEIVLEDIRNEKTLEKMKSLDMRTPSGIYTFLNDTPVGKHIAKVFEEFGFIIDSIESNSHIVYGSNITLGVKPAL